MSLERESQYFLVVPIKEAKKDLSNSFCPFSWFLFVVIHVHLLLRSPIKLKILQSYKTRGGAN